MYYVSLLVAILLAIFLYRLTSPGALRLLSIRHGFAGTFQLLYILAIIGIALVGNHILFQTVWRSTPALPELGIAATSDDKVILPDALAQGHVATPTPNASQPLDANATTSALATLEAGVSATANAQLANESEIQATSQALALQKANSQGTLTAQATQSAQLKATTSALATQDFSTQATKSALATNEAQRVAIANAQATGEAIAKATVSAQVTAEAKARETATAKAQATMAAEVKIRPTATPTPIKEFTPRVAADGKVNLRDGPGTGYPIVDQLNNGENVTILGRTGDSSWLQIRNIRGTVGWISSSYVQSSRPIPEYSVVAAPAPPDLTCQTRITPDLAAYWNQAELGCPTAPAKLTWASWTPYERGHVIWLDDSKNIYGFFQSGWWLSVSDTWDGHSTTPSRGVPPPGLLEPIRGSGHVWGTNDTFFNELGWAKQEQKGFCALLQTFERGFILRTDRTVENCKDNLFNRAREGDFGFDYLKAVNQGNWQAGTR